MLRAAREAFAESGYGVPLDEIAARAGVGPGTVYRHFPAKEALFEAVVTARITDLVSDARARADAADPGEAFFGFLARIAGEAAAKRDLPDAISIAGSLREDLFAALDLLLRRAQQAGAVRAGISDVRPHRAAEGHVRQPGRQRRPGPARAGVRRAGRRAAPAAAQT